MTVNDVLPTVLYILGIILLTALIILTIRTTITMNKIDKAVDNINVKLKSLDDLFNVIELITGKVNVVTEKVINGIVLVVDKFFKSKGEK